MMNEFVNQSLRILMTLFKGRRQSCECNSKMKEENVLPTLIGTNNQCATIEHVNPHINFNSIPRVHAFLQKILTVCTFFVKTLATHI